jgi:hypothetical protein
MNWALGLGGDGQHFTQDSMSAILDSSLVTGPSGNPVMGGSGGDANGAGGGQDTAALGVTIDTQIAALAGLPMPGNNNHPAQDHAAYEPRTLYFDAWNGVLVQDEQGETDAPRLIDGDHPAPVLLMAG